MSTAMVRPQFRNQEGTLLGHFLVFARCNPRLPISRRGFTRAIASLHTTATLPRPSGERKYLLLWCSSKSAVHPRKIGECKFGNCTRLFQMSESRLVSPVVKLVPSVFGHLLVTSSKIPSAH